MRYLHIAVVSGWFWDGLCQLAVSKRVRPGANGTNKWQKHPGKLLGKLQEQGVNGREKAPRSELLKNHLNS